MSLFFFSSRRLHTRCALVTGVQTCALPIYYKRAVLSEPGETTVFSWVEWPSKAARVAGWEKIMADERMKNDPNKQPFDGKRMIYADSRPSSTPDIPPFSTGRAWNVATN